MTIQRISHKPEADNASYTPLIEYTSRYGQKTLLRVNEVIGVTQENAGDGKIRLKVLTGHGNTVTMQGPLEDFMKAWLG